MMSLFNFGKKKEEKKTPVCACGCPKNETEEVANRSHSEAKDELAQSKYWAQVANPVISSMRTQDRQ